jgi:AcrR family transcriptional regulator
MIAKAAYEIGLDRITMKAVADRLGVSVPGLYHHLDGRDDLLRLAAEYSTAQIEVPVDHGQGWAEWLLEWSRYAYDAFVAQPQLVDQFRRGTISVDRMVVHVDAVIGLLTREGFSLAEARDAYGLVSQCAVGAAINRIRDSESARDGHGLVAEYHRALAARRPDELPHLRRLVAEHRPAPTVDEQIVTVLVGIAVRRGEPWAPILTLATGADVIPLHP